MLFYLLMVYLWQLFSSVQKRASCSQGATRWIVSDRTCINEEKFSIDWFISSNGRGQLLAVAKGKTKKWKPPKFHWKLAFYFKTKEDVILEIANDYSLTIEGKPLPVSIVELTPMRLVLLDTFGYHLVLEQKGSVITLYDEAEDCHYSLTKIA